MQALPHDVAVLACFLFKQQPEDPIKRCLGPQEAGQIGVGTGRAELSRSSSIDAAEALPAASVRRQRMPQHVKRSLIQLL
ncbi:hypothetical protein [Salibacterium aidingense]|uniref:hypothetical protein n=1 Tax=Salibacterium aidingense TaxID=384933 RepID=UPI003BC27B3B